MNAIRSIYSGAPVRLRACLADVDGVLVPTIGIQIYDDEESPLACFQAFRDQEELSLLCEMLDNDQFDVQFFNETLLPVLGASCRAEASKRAAAVQSLMGSSEAGVGPSNEVRERALDAVEKTVDPKNSDPSVLRADVEIPLQLAGLDAGRLYLVGNGSVSLADQDQGEELERLVFQAFDFLCPSGAFRRPLVRKDSGTRELCDVLALSRVPIDENEGLFVIQSKVEPIWRERLSRHTERRALSIQKNVQRAVKQLAGAVRTLRRGRTILRSDGVPLRGRLPDENAQVEALEALDLSKRAKNVGHAIAIVSELHQAVDWKMIGLELAKATSKFKFLFHVMDLSELLHLVAGAKGSPAVFESHLIHRWEAMVTNRTALIRVRFKEGRS